jgi:hypothetical protein
MPVVLFPERRTCQGTITERTRHIKEEESMALSLETLKAMMRDYQGVPLSDAELELIRPELDNYLAAVDALRDLDLSQVLSARLLRVQEGEQP